MNDFVNESKADKFKRLGNDRLDAALTAIERLEALTVKATYEYTEEDAAVVLQNLQYQIDKLERAFENGGPEKKKRSFL